MGIDRFDTLGYTPLRIMNIMMCTTATCIKRSLHEQRAEVDNAQFRGLLPGLPKYIKMLRRRRRRSHALDPKADDNEVLRVRARVQMSEPSCARLYMYDKFRSYALDSCVHVRAS